MTAKRIELGLYGNVLRENIGRMRKAKRLTYTALSNELAAAGRPIPILGLRRIETGDRRVDVDDLVAVAEIFGVSLSDLLDPALCQVCAGVPPVGLSCKSCDAASSR